VVRSTCQGFSLYIGELKGSVSSSGGLKGEEGRSAPLASVLGTVLSGTGFAFIQVICGFPPDRADRFKNPLENRKYTALSSHLLPYAEMFC